MNSAINPLPPYAVLRVDKRKAKAMGAIAAASAHQLRQRPTPNANANGPAPVIMYLAAGATPYQSAHALIEGAERRNKTTVLAREIILSASPSYFRPGMEECGGEFDVARMKAWAFAALEWAKHTWPDQLASFVVHLDELTVHAHLICIPRERKPDGGWRLNSKKYFDRERLRELQTSYGKAMAPLGIRRGEPGSKATHSEVKQFYHAAKQTKSLTNRPSPPPPPKPPKPPVNAMRRAFEPLASACGIETAYSREQQEYAEQRRAWVKQMKAYKQVEEKRWHELKALAAVAPLRRREKTARGVVPPTTHAPTPTTPRPRAPGMR